MVLVVKGAYDISPPALRADGLADLLDGYRIACDRGV